MSTYKPYIRDGIGLLIATLYTLAGQAHFTSALTPGLAADIEIMTPNSYEAMGGLGMNYDNFKRVTGSCDLLAAAMLWRKSTRTVGLWLAVIGFGGGLYGQVYSGGDWGQVGGLLGLAVVGVLLSP